MATLQCGGCRANCKQSRKKKKKSTVDDDTSRTRIVSGKSMVLPGTVTSSGRPWKADGSCFCFFLVRAQRRRRHRGAGVVADVAGRGDAAGQQPVALGRFRLHHRDPASARALARRRRLHPHDARARPRRLHQVRPFNRYLTGRKVSIPNACYLEPKARDRPGNGT